MGYLKDKYTKEYYTGKDEKGNPLKYGATSSLDENGNYILRKHDLLILERVNFKDKNVLALGCGRGEELAYAIEKGAKVENSVGVDFSQAAIKIAKKLFKEKKLELPELYIEDALDFVVNYSEKIKQNKFKKFDIVIMFDFVEHIPRMELIKVFEGLKNLLKKESLLVINTPAYKYDNDVIKDGYDERNQMGSFDTSDIVLETQGMHCNKYSLISLQKFMAGQEFINISEAHFFILEGDKSQELRNVSYYNRWSSCRINDFPILGEYIDDEIEYPYPINSDLKLTKFEEGNLEGISLILTEDYKRVAYPSGNTDVQMIEDISTSNPKVKIIFDVGTFVGASSLIFSKLVGFDGKVFGFEPNPFNRNRCFKNISHNPNLSNNLSIYHYALGKENKDEQMVLSSEIDSGYSSTSRLKGSHSKLHDSELPEGFEEISVQVKTLDTFIKENKFKPDIIKVDIEGAEYDFLLGALETIRKYKPILYIEIHSEYCAIRCFEILRSEGYSLTIINEESDNRIMIKAKYIERTEKVSDSTILSSALRNLDSTFLLLTSMNKQIDALTKSFEIYKNRIKKLEVDNERITCSRYELENKINELEVVKRSIENSKSWKITRPFREIRELLRKVINKIN